MKLFPRVVKTIGGLLVALVVLLIVYGLWNPGHLHYSIDVNEYCPIPSDGVQSWQALLALSELPIPEAYSAIEDLDYDSFEFGSPAHKELLAYPLKKT